MQESLLTMAEKPRKLDPFVQLDSLIPAVSDLYTQIKMKNESASANLTRILDIITTITAAMPNATLAAIHLSKQQSPLKQPVYSAALAYLLSQVLKLDESTQQSLLYAVLTCNLTFYEYQVLLNTMDGKLTDAQRAKLQKHPIQAAQFMEAAGFINPYMIKAIRQHHERLDGTGYPNHLKSDEISTLALIIQICETYTARIDTRAYRKSVNPREALAPLLKETDKRMKDLLLAFARAIGIYPPGTWVKLVNNEIAVVIAHQRTSPIPRVRALFDPNGIPYMGPIERDCTLAEFKIVSSTSPPCMPSVDLPALFH